MFQHCNLPRSAVKMCRLMRSSSASQKHYLLVQLLAAQIIYCEHGIDLDNCMFGMMQCNSTAFHCSVVDILSVIADREGIVLLASVCQSAYVRLSVRKLNQ